MANSDHHYWNHGAPGEGTIVSLKQGAPGSYFIASVRNIWQPLMIPYFRSRPALSQIYQADQIVYRGATRRPLRVTRVDVFVQLVQFYLRKTLFCRDVLWVLCQPERMETRQGWILLAREAITRLTAAFPDRKVFVILAIGLKWMPFVWDPTIPASNGAALKFPKHTTGFWEMDLRMHMIPQTLLPDQSHISKESMIVDSRLAYSLDYWIKNEHGTLVNMQSMHLLESLFAMIQTQEFAGINPAH